MNLPTRETLFSILPAAFVVIAGCRTGVQPPHLARADAYDAGHVTLSGARGDDLRRETAFEQERIARDQYGLLTVTIPLRSAVDHSQHLEYRYSFFDSNGRLIEGPMGWTRVTLEAGSPGTIQFTSTQPQAADFHVNVRYQR